MRVLFVSGTVTGGDAVSTRQLAEHLAVRDVEVARLVRRRTRARPDLVATPSPARRAAAHLAGGLWREVRRRTTRRARIEMTDDAGPRWESVAPEVVLPRLHATLRPDVVVVSSVNRRAWTAIHSWATSAEVPIVYYVRDEATVHGVPLRELPPDVVLTNAVVHAHRLAALGLRTVTVPSLVDLDGCRLDSTREAVLFVNPIRTRGLDLAIALAGERPDLPFAFQLSWPLGRRDRRALERRLEGRPNIELRPYTDELRAVYRDARVLLLPYCVDNRPRVVVEAQSNGIPVLATDLPAHREAVGSGGLYVAPHAPLGDWTAALAALWRDSEASQRVRSAAVEHSRRVEQDIGHIVDCFLDVVGEAIDRSARRGP